MVITVVIPDSVTALVCQQFHSKHRKDQLQGDYCAWLVVVIPDSVTALVCHQFHSKHRKDQLHGDYCEWLVQ